MQFGCGGSNPPDFVNFDASINLYLQRNFLTRLFWKHAITYPDTIYYGDIVKGLPIQNNSMKGIYSSHVLEHLSYNDCKRALDNTFRYLKPGGIFRCILPNLELLVNAYLDDKKKNEADASVRFMEYSFLGYKEKPKTFIELLRWYYTTDNHYWMWDNESLTKQLIATGFSDVYVSEYGKSADPVFIQAEDSTRFYGAIVLEAIK